MRGTTYNESRGPPNNDRRGTNYDDRRGGTNYDDIRGTLNQFQPPYDDHRSSFNQGPY